MKAEKKLKNCPKGHRYAKSSDCPICPTCEAENMHQDGFLSLFSAPARRALENNGISTIEQLSAYSEKEILRFHSLGKASLPILRAILEQKGLIFKK